MMVKLHEPAICFEKLEIRCCAKPSFQGADKFGVGTRCRAPHMCIYLSVTVANDPFEILPRSLQEATFGMWST